MSDTTKGGGKGRGGRPGGSGARGGGKGGRPGGAGGDRRGPRPGQSRGEGGEGDRAPRERGDAPRFQRRGPPREAGAAEAGGAARRDGKPFRKRDHAASAERSESGQRRTGGFDRRPSDASSGDDTARAKKPFTPKSRGMRSHAGAESAGARRGDGARPKSYGRLSHDGADGAKPRRERPQGGSRGDRPARTEREAEKPAEAETAATLEPMRIARRLARAGVASRRDAEAMIAEGRIAVNGKVLDTPALDVSPNDRITVDGEPLPAMERTRLWLFHKPAGLVTTNRDPEGRPTVFEHLPKEMPRVLSVGRLDITTEGLLLLTNDGGLARVLELPSTGWLRRYRVRAHGSIDQAKLDELREGVAIDGVFYGAIEATLDRVQGANVWLTLGLREGKNREVKRVLGHLGLDVNRLIRLSYGPFQLADLAEGSVREIHGKTLRDQLGPRLIEESGADFDAPIVNAFSNKAVEGARRAEGDRPAGAKGPKGRTQSERGPARDTAPNAKRAREAKRDDALGRLDTRPGRSVRNDRPDRREAGERRPFKPRGERPDRGEGDPRPARSFDKPRKPHGERPDARTDRGGAPRSRTQDAPRGDKPFGGQKKPYGARDAAGEGDRPAAAKRPPFGGRRSANVWIAPGARPQGPKKAEEAAERAAGRTPLQRMAKPGSRGKKPGGGGRGGKPGGPGGDRPRGPRKPRQD
ncbi:pseudouridine synthase [Jiella sp. M17.18]|uniref:pseudouridine synthase n=1 Tax=Jiella sp. M17.18 TaxID=3234247 RepID=UPI0034DFD810